MNWEVAGVVAEIVGAAGVVVTLIYLTMELRRNTAATRQQSYHDLVTRRSTWFESIAADPELMQTFISGQKGSDLGEVESQQYVCTMINFMSHFQDVYMQRRNGIIEASVWEAEMKMLSAATAAAGFKAWWGEASQYFVEDFVDEVARVEKVYPVIYNQEKHQWMRPESTSPWDYGTTARPESQKDTPARPLGSDG